MSAKSRQSLDKRIRILKTLMHSNELLRPLQYRYLMKIDPLFKDCLADVAPEIRSEVRLNMDIANRIYDILQEKNMTQREFAALMGKCESEISRWLTGSHGFTTTSIAKISAVLNEPIVEVKHKPDVNIQMRLTSISEESFMMSPGKIADDANSEAIQLGFSNQIQPDVENNKMTLIFGTKYELEGEVILESVYRFEFEVKDLARFINTDDNNNITISHIMPHLISVAIGTMRGILVVKTAGTNLSKFPLPMIDPNQLSANLSSPQE